MFGILRGLLIQRSKLFQALQEIVRSTVLSDVNHSLANHLACYALLIACQSLDGG